MGCCSISGAPMLSFQTAVNLFPRIRNSAGDSFVLPLLSNSLANLLGSINQYASLTRNGSYFKLKVNYLL